MKALVLLCGVLLAPAPSRAATAATDHDPLLAALAGEFALLDERYAEAGRAYALAATWSMRADFAQRAARLALHAEDAHTAADMATLWHARDPADTAATQAAVLAHVGHGDTAAAITALQALAARDDEGADAALRTLAAMPAKEGLSILRELAVQGRLQALPPGERSAVALAVRWKDLDLARRLADDGIRLHPKQSRAWLWRAVVQAAREDRAGAAQSYARALALNPDNVDLRLSYVQLLNELGREREIDAVLQAAPVRDYRVYAARMALAVMLKQPKRYPRLEREVRRDRDLDADSRALLLGQLAELRARPAQALEHYRAVHGETHRADALLRSAVLLFGEDRAAALAALREVQDSGAAEAPQAFLLEAELLGQAGDPAAARSALDRGLESYYDHLELLYARAILSAGQRETAAAETDLRRILEEHPDHAAALNALGYTLADAGLKLDEALDLIQRAQALAPEDPAIMDSMGWVLHRLGRSAESRTWLEQAYAKAPDDEIAAHLGIVLFSLGEPQAARELWRARLRDNAPPAAPLREALTRWAPELLP